MSAPVATADAPPAAMLTHRQILTIFAGLMIGMFLAALDQTIVATSIRTIADDLDGLSLQAWATTAYLITATITTPLYGKLSDLFGRKPLFLLAISIFVVGSIACTFATSMYQLAAFRGVQGLGAGGLFSLALTIIGDIVAPRERAKYQGYFVAVFGTSSVLGPIAGGFFAGQPELLGITGWRWVFLINVPLGILALIVVTKVLNIPHTKRKRRIDWPGAVALAVALVPLLIVAEQGRTWGWDSGRAFLCYGIGVFGVAAFLLFERRIGDDALLPLRFFRTGVFGWGSVAIFVAGMGMFGALALLPLYLQIVKGSTPTEAGLQTLPLVLGIMSMSIFSGQMISRTGRYKIWPIIGLSLMIVGIATLSRIGVDTPYWQTALIMVVIGWGLGGNMQPLTLAVQNAMPPRDMGVATASATFFRQMGGTLGTAVFLSILFSTLGQQVADKFRAAAGSPAFRAALTDPSVLANPANAPILAGLKGGPLTFDDSSFLATADPVLARPILDGFADSMSIVFLAAAGVLVIGLLAVIMMKEVPLRTQSGVEAIRDEDTADRAASDRAASENAASGSAAPGNSAVGEAVAGNGSAATAAAAGAVLAVGALATNGSGASDEAKPGREHAAAGATAPRHDGVAPDRSAGVSTASAPAEAPRPHVGNGHADVAPVVTAVREIPEPAPAFAAAAPGSPAGSPEASSPVAGPSAAGSSGATPAASSPVDGPSAAGSPVAGSPVEGSPAGRSSAPGNSAEGSSAAGDPAAASSATGSPAGPVHVDVRDRLLAMLLPDPQRVIAAVAAAEQARDAARRAAREVEERTAELDGAADELVAQGLTVAQVRELLALTELEGPQPAQRGVANAEITVYGT